MCTTYVSRIGPATTRARSRRPTPSPPRSMRFDARADQVPAGELITTIGGIRRTQWAEKRFPTIEELDEAAPRHAVYLSERGAGPGQTNTAARDLLRGLGVAVTDDGAISNGPDTAKAYDVLAASLTNADRKRQMTDVAAYTLSVGMTSRHGHVWNRSWRRFHRSDQRL